LFYYLSAVGANTTSLEGSALLTRRGFEDTVRQREFESRVVELLNVGATSIRSLDFLHLKDLQTTVGHTMLSGHFLKQLVDGANAGGISEFLPDVVSGGAGLVAKRDAEILHLARMLLLNRIHCQYFTLRASHFVQLRHEVPKAAFGDRVIRGEEEHAIDFGRFFCGGRLLSANHLKLLDRHRKTAKTDQPQGSKQQEEEAAEKSAKKNWPQPDFFSTHQSFVRFFFVLFDRSASLSFKHHAKQVLNQS
jgi:hypothetical protein